MRAYLPFCEQPLGQLLVDQALTQYLRDRVSRDALTGRQRTLLGALDEFLDHFDAELRRRSILVRRVVVEGAAVHRG